MYQTDCGFLIKKIADDISKDANHALKDQDITISQLRFLEYLLGKNCVELKDAERFFGVSQPTIAGITARLIKKDMIVLAQSHGRAKTAALTPKGISVLTEAMKHRDQTEARLFSGLEPEEVSELRRLLVKISHSIQKN